MVQLLLDKGADINAQGGRYGSALQAASFRGHKAVVQQLLDKGADCNIQGGRYGNTLQAASLRGHEAVVQLLLDKGVNVNAQRKTRQRSAGCIVWWLRGGGQIAAG
jgi:ankyrin repeat protein